MTSTDRRGPAARTPRIMAVGAALLGALVMAPGVDAQAPQQGQRPAHSAERGALRGNLDPAQRIERPLAMLTERLELNADQQTRIRSILLEEQTQMRAFFEANGMQRPARAQGERPVRVRPDSGAVRQRPAVPSDSVRAELRQRVEAIRTNTQQRIEAVLTAQQRTTYRELLAQRAERGSRGERPMGPRGQRGTRSGTSPVGSL